MENKKMPAQVQAWGKYMKGKLIFARLMGLIACLLCAGALVLLYFKIFNMWMCIITVVFSMACIFISNSFLQSVKTGKTWQVVNLLLAMLCYLAVITFVVMAFLEGEFTFDIFK